MLLALMAALCGCGGGSNAVIEPTPPPTPAPPPVYTPPAGNYAGAAFSGKVMAGGTPIAGAAVQLYAAGTAGNGSAPTQLLATALTTDSSGGFSANAAYTCPAGTSILLVVASGGRAGAGGATNAGTVLMSSPGACNSITVGASYTLNEVTTVASAYAFAQFLKAGAQLGASSTNSSGITLAAGTLANLVNLTTGSMPGAQFPGTGTAPAARINALANLLNACIVSSGVSSSACTNLYADAAGDGPLPGTTLDAVLNVVHHPAVNVAALFGLASASSAYAPTLSKAPSDWTLFAQYTGGGMNGPAGVAIDSAGRVWVSDTFSVASLFTNSGAPVFPAGVTGGGLFESYGVAIDSSDNAWFVNQESPASVNNRLGSVTVLSPSGTATSGSAGYVQGGLNFPRAIAIDPGNVAWVTDYGDAHLTLLSSSGAPQSGAAGYTSSDFAFPDAIAIDSKDNGWLANFSGESVSKVAPDGTATTVRCCDGPSGVAIDGGDNVWVTNFYGGNVSLLSSGGAMLSGGGFNGGGISSPQGVAIDGGGTAWIANYRGPSLSELAGVASGNPGQALSPAVGWGPDASLLEAFGIAIDAAGDIWVSGFGNNTLTEFVGLAAPVKTPLLGPVRVP